jgi:hypothetical protein
VSAAAIISGARERITDALTAVGSTPNASGVMWQCPAHNDRTPSLSVSDKTGDKPGVMIHCFSGCSTSAIVSALNLRMEELFDNYGDRTTPAVGIRPQVPRVVARYEYVDHAGEILSTKQRKEPGPNGRPKTFVWTSGNPGVLYQLPLVVEAGTVWINEGEKGADRLQDDLPANHAATCAPTTAWNDDFNTLLSGKKVVIVQDRDESGEKQAGRIASSLTDAGIDFQVVVSKTENDKDDAFDHLEAGHGINDFQPAEVNDRASPPPKPTVGIRSRRLDTIEQRPIEWLWPGKVEVGGATLLDGDGDSGKTTVTCDLVARMTAGTEWPDGQEIERPIRVGWIEADPDGFGTKIGPIIAQAGGDLSMVEDMSLVEDPSVYGKLRLPAFPNDLGMIAEFVRENRIEFLVLSPISALLAEKINPNSEAGVRRAMSPAARELGELGCAQWWIRHLGKDPKQRSAQSKGLGSVAWRAIARNALFLGRDMTGEDEERRILGVTKGNNVPDNERKALAFRITGGLGVVPRISWLGETDFNPDALVDDSEGKLGECRRWVRSLYESRPPGTGIAVTEIQKLGKAAGFSETTIKRAYAAETNKHGQRRADGSIECWLRVLREES